MTQLKTIADRVWYAWHCLPRKKNGRLPSRRSLEQQQGISPATLSKLMAGERVNVRVETIDKVAKALRVTPEWLMSGRGAGPAAHYPVPARPMAGADFKEAEAERKRSFQEQAVDHVGEYLPVAEVIDVSAPRGEVTLRVRRAGDEPTWSKAELEAREIGQHLPGWTFVAARSFCAPAHPSPIYAQYVLELASLVHQSASIAEQATAQKQDAREKWERLLSWHQEARETEDAWRKLYERSRPASGEYQVTTSSSSSVPPAPKASK